MTSDAPESRWYRLVVLCNNRGARPCKTLKIRERLSAGTKLGLGLILRRLSDACRMARRRVEAAHSLGDALFLGASLLSAGFTVPMSRAKPDPLHAAALVSTGSLALYGTLYLALRCAPRPAAGPPRLARARSNAFISRCAVTSSSQSRIRGRLGFSAKTFKRSNSLAASGSSRADLNTASRPLSQNQDFRSTSSIFSRSISKVSHCSSAAASSSRATASACIIAPNRAGSRA